MKPKILVAYASKSGSTVDVAQAIGESLSQTGGAVDVISVKQIKSLDGYDGVILGSAIRMEAGCRKRKLSSSSTRLN